MGSTNFVRLNAVILPTPHMSCAEAQKKTEVIVTAIAHRSNTTDRRKRLQIGKIATILRSALGRFSRVA